MSTKYEGQAKDTPTNMDDSKEGSRRDVVGASVAALIGLAISACGSDDSSPPAAPAGGAGGSAGSTSGGTHAGGSNAAGSTAAGGTAAGSTSGGSANGGTGGGGSANDAADVSGLNAALTLEYGAIAAYTLGAMFLGAVPAADPLAALAPTILAVAGGFLGQHKAHAQALVDTITALGGTPVDGPTVEGKFAPPADLAANLTILNLLRFAARAELNAAIAYNELQDTMGVTEQTNRLLVTSIEGDETQHFIILTALVAGLAAPGAALTTASGGGAVPFDFVYGLTTTSGAQKGLDDTTTLPYFYA